MRSVLLALAFAGSGAMSAAAEPPSAGDACFLSRDYQAFRAVNDHSFYVRANLHDYFQVQLDGSCPGLTDPQARLITVEHGETRICGPLDWQLEVASPSQPAVGCIVKSQRRLTPQEAAAIPAGQRP